MNYIEIHKLTDLQFVLDQPILITGNVSLEKEEIFENMWAISFDDSLVLKMTLQNFQDFLSQLLCKRTEQIRPLSTPATFYIWYDAMALQLRFNLLSGKDIALPFGCTLNEVSSPDIIFKKYLDDAQRAVERGGHILLSDMEEVFGDDDEEEEEYVLDIYIVTIE